MEWNQHAIRGSHHAVLLKPSPNRTNHFRGIRLSPDHLPLWVGAITGRVIDRLVRPVPDSRLRDRLKPFALLRRYPQPWVVVTLPATTASLPLRQHWSSADLSLRKLARGSGVARVASFVRL